MCEKFRRNGEEQNSVNSNNSERCALWVNCSLNIEKISYLQTQQTALTFKVASTYHTLLPHYINKPRLDNSISLPAKRIILPVRAFSRGINFLYGAVGIVVEELGAD